MDRETATQKLASWLKPYVMAWVLIRRDTVPEDLHLPNPLCNACGEPTFGSKYCTGCTKKRAEDFEGFCEFYTLCPHCETLVNTAGHCDTCSYDYDQYQEEEHSGPCRSCGRETAGTDWAWTGHCSRYCARAEERYERRSLWRY